MKVATRDKKSGWCLHKLVLTAAYGCRIISVKVKPKGTGTRSQQGMCIKGKVMLRRLAFLVFFMLLPWFYASPGSAAGLQLQVTIPHNDFIFNSPQGVAVDGSGNFYMADTNNSRILKFSATGAFLTAWGSHGTANGEFIGWRGRG